MLLQLKPAPALVLSLVPIAPSLATTRHRHRVLAWLLSLWGALVTSAAAIALALWLDPAVTAEGHRVMPIGQVLLGGPLGAVAGFFAFGRATPAEADDVARMSKLCALAVPSMLVVCAFDHLLG